MAAPPAAPDSASESVERRVLERLRPTPAFLDRLATVRERLLDRVRTAARERGSPLVRALIAGSAARGTFLADRVDIDLFLLFPPELPPDRLAEEGLPLARAVLEAPAPRYAEHPYLRGRFEGFAVDAVPGYAVADSSAPLSAVDRTPFHHAYLTARQSPEMIDQVRLTKQFFRVLGVYGSEARTEGFSGYLTELLVLRFGSFRAFLEASRSWRIPTRLLEGTPEPPRVPRNVALVLADPVDPERNVASALSARNLGIVLVAAPEYLSHPSEEWFTIRARTPLSLAEALERVRARSTHVAEVTLARPDRVDDILYPQIRKAERAIAEEVQRAGFELVGSASAAGSDSLVVLIETASAHRAAVRFHRGPPAGIDRVGSFLAKWTRREAPALQGPYVAVDGSLAVEARLAPRGLEDVLREALPRLPLGRDLRSSEPTAARVRPLEESTESPELRAALTDLLAKELPWRRPAAGR